MVSPTNALIAQIRSAEKSAVVEFTLEMTNVVCSRDLLVKGENEKGSWVKLRGKNVYLWSKSEETRKKTELQKLLNIETRWTKILGVTLVATIVIAMVSLESSFVQVGVIGVVGAAWKLRKVRIQISELSGHFGEQFVVKRMRDPNHKYDW